MNAPITRPDPHELLAHAAFLRRLAGSLLRDGHAAEDLVQDTLAVALDRRDARVENLRSWLAGIARNLARMSFRAEARRRRRELAVARRSTVDPAATVAAELELQRRVVEAVAELAEPYRSTIVDRYHHDLGPSEIARSTGVPRETVKTRLVRGLARLRARLDEDHGGDRRAWAAPLLPLVAGKMEGTGSTLAPGVLLMSLKAAFAGLQARQERAFLEIHRALPADRRKAFDDIEPALLLFR